MKLTGSLMLASLMVVFAVPSIVTSVQASQPVCTNVATTFDANPVISGTSVNITGTVAQASLGQGCAGGTNSTPVTVGTSTIQENMVSGAPAACGKGICAGGPTPGAVCENSAQCSPTLGGTCQKAKFEDIVSNTPDSNGKLSTLFDTTGLGGSIGFRTKYVGDAQGFKDNASPCEDLAVNDVACTGANIAATLASGPGEPAPGTSACWVFRITVSSCQDETNVTAQGGSNGWTSKIGLNGSKILSTSAGSAAVRNNNQRNDVILWNIGNMSAGSHATMDVQVCGTTAKFACPSDPVTEFLTGSWSTTFTPAGGVPTKSDYTGRVSIDVTCPL
jgi:hypothetical protein